jgi:hypothetical protein
MHMVNAQVEPAEGSREHVVVKEGRPRESHAEGEKGGSKPPWGLPEDQHLSWRDRSHLTPLYGMSPAAATDRATGPRLGPVFGNDP